MALKAGQWLTKGKAISAELGFTKSGNEQLCVTFDTDDELHARVSKYLFFSDKAMEMTFKALEALGVDVAAADYRIDTIVNQDMLIGKEATLVLEMESVPEEFGGGERVTVVFINRPGGGGMRERMAPEQAAAFGGTLRDKIRKFAAVAGKDGGGAAKAAAPAKAAPAVKKGPRPPQGASETRRAPAAGASDPRTAGVPF